MRGSGWSIAVAALVAAEFLLCAVATEETTAPASPPTTDPYLQCMSNLAADPQFSDIAAKLPLKDMSSISFAMLADETRPTPIERKEISDWFDKREECIKAGDALHRAQWPPELYQLAVEGSTGVKAIGVDLYNRKMTFGEANRQIEQLGNATRAKMIPIVKQYQAELAAQKANAEQRKEAQAQFAEQQRAQYEAQAQNAAAQAQAARLQRAQLFMNFMQAQQQQRIQVAPPRPTYTTNCFTAGGNTNCTTH